VFSSTPGLPGDEVDDAWVGSCRNCFVGSLLGDDIFPRGELRWMAPSCLVVAIGDGAYRGEETSWGVVM
jgi:hypothetical protein